MTRGVVEQIKARLSIEDVIGSYIKLEQAGKSLKAKCPFHNEKTPSFFVSPDRGGYYCFGCGAKGDIFTFVEHFEGLDFRGALKILADRAGVVLIHDNASFGERDVMLRIMEEASRYFEAQFAQSKEARDYVRSRGIADATCTHFRIGWAPEGWRNVSAYLIRKGFDEVLLEKVGLVKRKDDTSQHEKERGYYDRFRDRIMFPICDSSGRIIAFSGRIVKGDTDTAKYINSPDTPLYDKSSVLYGLDKAKSEIRRMNYSILVEGQMDLVMSHQAGMRNTVAASGTALGDEIVNRNGALSNLGLLRRLSPNIIIAFDSDIAGRKAALRVARIALGIGMDVKIADIVGGKDPADIIKKNVEDWKNTLRSAYSVVEFELGNVVREVSGSRAVSQAISERVLPLVAEIERASDRSHFVQMISEKTHIPIDIVWQDLGVIEQRRKEDKEKSKDPSRGISVEYGTSIRTSSEHGKRLDLVERRLLGLLYLIEREDKSRAEKYHDRFRTIAGESYGERKECADGVMHDISFEAEAFFGNDPKGWERHIEELFINFEEDVVSEELIRTMHELRSAELVGDTSRLAELAQKCQVLSLRKAEIGKRRRG